MTSTASPDSVEPTAGQPPPRPDELEHWLTDIRVNLGEDTQAWLESADDPDDPAAARPAGLHATTDQSPRDEDEPRGHIGRHRAAD